MNFVSQKYDTIPVPIIQENLGNVTFSLFFWCAILFESELSNRRLPQIEETKAKKPGGKKEGQKYKFLLVWDILLKKADENPANCIETPLLLARSRG